MKEKGRSAAAAIGRPHVTSPLSSYLCIELIEVLFFVPFVCLLFVGSVRRLHLLSSNLNFPLFVHPLVVDWPHCEYYGAKAVRLVRKARYVVTFQKVFFYVPFFPTDCIQRDLVAFGRFYENDILDEMAPIVPSGSIVFDIGSNIGNHAVYWAVKRRAAKVYAFEPVPSTFAILTRNIELNHLEGRVIPFNVAVSDSEEKLSISHYSLDNIGAMDLKKEATGDISAITLDSFKFPEGRVDFVKIDVEAFECHVIRGGLAFLRRTKPKHIFIEIWTNEHYVWMGRTLGQLGYSMVKTFGGNYLYRLEDDGATKITESPPLPRADHKEPYFLK